MRTSELSRLPVAASWMTGDGPESDVVIASRVRLGRNIAGFPYSHVASSETRARLLEHIDAAIRDELFPEPFNAESIEIAPGSLTANERRFLADRSLADDHLPARLIVAADEKLVIQLDGIDHVRIAATRPGLDLSAALDRVRKVDVSLESRLQYAVSMDWGYLSTRITDLGTAMRASVLVHVPALALLGRLPSMSRSMSSSGYELIPYHADETFSLTLDPDEAVAAELAAAGDDDPMDVMIPTLCLLRNTRTLGSAEEVIAAKLDDYTTKLIHYERVAREELVRDHASAIADAANRALHTLRSARSLTASEARILVGQLRLGVVADLVNEASRAAVTSLLLIGEDSQSARWTPAAERDDIDSVRARVFRDVLLEE